MEDFKIKNNIDSDNFSLVYYSLMNQEKIIYINIIELLLLNKNKDYSFIIKN